MFKKGQLVKSSFGNLYIIDYVDGCRARVTSILGDFKILILTERLRLIGNNYQAKPKCSR